MPKKINSPYSTWTKEPPKEDGYYWFFGSAKYNTQQSTLEIVSVYNYTKYDLDKKTNGRIESSAHAAISYILIGYADPDNMDLDDYVGVWMKIPNPILPKTAWWLL